MTHEMIQSGQFETKVPIEGSAAKILIVDDDADIRSSLDQLLTLSGYEVTVAANAILGRHLYNNNQFNLVITDILMPDKNGLEFILQLKSCDHAAKIIAISGGGKSKGTRFLELATEMGAELTLAKPVSGDVLLEAVQHVLRPWDHS